MENKLKPMFRKTALLNKQIEDVIESTLLGQEPASVGACTVINLRLNLLETEDYLKASSTVFFKS